MVDTQVCSCVGDDVEFLGLGRRQGDQDEWWVNLMVEGVRREKGDEITGRTCLGLFFLSP